MSNKQVMKKPILYLITCNNITVYERMTDTKISPILFRYTVKLLGILRIFKVYINITILDSLSWRYTLIPREYSATYSRLVVFSTLLQYIRGKG